MSIFCNRDVNNNFTFPCLLYVSMSRNHWLKYCERIIILTECWFEFLNEKQDNDVQRRWFSKQYPRRSRTRHISFKWLIMSLMRTCLAVQVDLTLRLYENLIVSTWDLHYALITYPTGMAAPLRITRNTGKRIIVGKS